jgi:hypothetical protein
LIGDGAESGGGGDLGTGFDAQRWPGIRQCLLRAGLWRTTEQDQDCPQESQPNVEREGKDQHPSRLHGYLA